MAVSRRKIKPLKSLIRLPYFEPHGPLSRKDFDLCAEMKLGVGGIDI